MTDVVETAIIDHGSHNVDMLVKGHFQEEGQPRRWWNRVLGKRSCDNRGGVSGEFLEAKGDWDGGLGGRATVNGLGAWEDTQGE